MLQKPENMERMYGITEVNRLLTKQEPIEDGSLNTSTSTNFHTAGSHSGKTGKKKGKEVKKTLRAMETCHYLPLLIWIPGHLPSSQRPGDNQATSLNLL